MQRWLMFDGYNDGDDDVVTIGMRVEAPRDLFFFLARRDSTLETRPSSIDLADVEAEQEVF